jgi:hypothetical protein
MTRAIYWPTGGPVISALEWYFTGPALTPIVITNNRGGSFNTITTNNLNTAVEILPKRRVQELYLK